MGLEVKIESEELELRDPRSKLREMEEDLLEEGGLEDIGADFP